MNWLPAVLPVITALLLIFIPGLAVGLAARLRGFTLWGLAPAFSITVIALASIAAPIVHLRWGLLPVAICTVALAAVVLLARWLVSRQWPMQFDIATVGIVRNSRSQNYWLVAGLVLAGATIAARLIFAIGAPTNFSQTYDSIFHLNALRYVLDTGNASSLSLGGLNLNGRTHSSFYPAGWHALTALVAQTSGSSIPVAINAVTLVLASVMWPVGAMLLARTVIGSRKVMFITFGVVAAGFAAFPYLMIDYGVLYPFALALAILSPLVALLVNSLGFAREPMHTRWMSALLVLVVLPGVTLTHPSVTMAAVAICLPMLLLIVISIHRWLRSVKASTWKYLLLYALSIALLALIVIVFMALGPGNVWGGKWTPLESVLNLLLGAPVGLGPAVVISLATFIGVWRAVKSRTNIWLVITWAIFAVMFLIGSFVDWSPIRTLIIGMWYGDVYRVSAMLAIVSLPLAVMGMIWIIDTLARLVTKTDRGLGRRVVIAIVLVLALIGIQFSNLNSVSQRISESYAMTADSPLLTIDEYQLLEKVDGLVPAGTTVAGNPWTGTSLVYALANRPALLMHVKYDTVETDIIGKRLQDATTDPAVCEAVRQLNVGYVLDFGTREIHGEHHLYPGFENLNRNPSVKEISRVGTASLWKITACG